MSLDRFLDLDEAANELGTTPDQVYRWVRAGILPALRTNEARWLVERDDLKGFRRSRPAG